MFIVNRLKQASLPVLAVIILSTGAVITPISVQADMFSSDKFSFYGDFRLRFEADWDSQTSSGAERRDRNRARIRARVGLKYKPTENFEYGVRLRTGSDRSAQSPHITIVDFDNQDTGAAQLNFDKWFLKAKYNGLWAWVGRNSIPFWKQNEMFWDDDVTPSGIAAGYKLKFGETELGLNTGYFSLPVGMQAFGGNLGLGQLFLSTKAGGNKFTAAAGALIFDANPDDPDVVAAVAAGDLLLKGTGQRDHSILIGSLQGQFKLGLPLTVGFDWMHNNKNYSLTDPNVTAANRDETDGYVISLKLGKVKNKGDWLLGYYYAHIETFAVNSAYAQDDWVRWGSAGETRGSDMKGHEFRGVYSPMDKLKIVARLYVVKAITDNNQEDGKRFRVDFNYKF
jgi:hypothetical protein